MTQLSGVAFLHVANVGISVERRNIEWWWRDHRVRSWRCTFLAQHRIADAQTPQFARQLNRDKTVDDRLLRTLTPRQLKANGTAVYIPSVSNNLYADNSQLQRLTRSNTLVFIQKTQCRTVDHIWKTVITYSIQRANYFSTKPSSHMTCRDWHNYNEHW